MILKVQIFNNFPEVMKEHQAVINWTLSGRQDPVIIQGTSAKQSPLAKN
jgi:hypothetical protein